MANLALYTPYQTVSKDKKTVSFNLPGDSKFLGYCMKPLKLNAQNSWGEFFGRINAPNTSSDVIGLFESDITITLPAVNKFLFTEPFLRTSPIFISNDCIYWKDQEPYILI